MPTYVFCCPVCERTREIFCKLRGGQIELPEDEGRCCGSEMKRLVRSPAIHYKGSGFYSTDYAAKPAPEVKEDAPSDKVPATPDKE